MLSWFFDQELVIRSVLGNWSTTPETRIRLTREVLDGRSRGNFDAAYHAGLERHAGGAGARKGPAEAALGHDEHFGAEFGASRSPSSDLGEHSARPALRLRRGMAS